MLTSDALVRKTLAGSKVTATHQSQGAANKTSIQRAEHDEADN